MEESTKKKHVEGGDREILYSKAIKAGKRIYYLDVKKNLKDDLFVAVTESKKIQSKDGAQVSFEKHKIFLYKEDFEKFMEGMQEVIDYIRASHLKDSTAETVSAESIENVANEPMETDTVSSDIKLDIDFWCNFNSLGRAGMRIFVLLTRLFLFSILTN